MHVLGLRTAAALLGAGLALAAAAVPASAATADTTPPTAPPWISVCPPPVPTPLSTPTFPTPKASPSSLLPSPKTTPTFPTPKASPSSLLPSPKTTPTFPTPKATPKATPTTTLTADPELPKASVPLCWGRSNDDVGVTGYDVQMKQDGAFVTIQSTTFTGVSVSPLVPGQSYTFRVIAKDAAGNASPPSAEYTAVARVYTGTQSPSPSPTPPSPDRTAPTRPEGVEPSNVYINGAAGLTWTKSTDDVAVSGYDVYAWIDGAFTRVDARFSPSGDKVIGVVEGLTPGRDYLFYVVAKDAAGNLSAPSDLVRQRAMVEPPVASPSPGTDTTDTTPPGTPTGLTIVGGISVPDGIALAWNTVSDNSGVPPRYDLFRRTDHGYAYEGENATPRDIVTGLEGGHSYTFQVVARDAAGNLSNPSAPYAAVAQALPPTAYCDVSYVTQTWPGGFNASVKLTNTGTTDIDGWTLAFSFPLTTQQVASGFNAKWTQTGRDVTAENLLWNKTIKPGQSFYLGFNGRQTAGNPSPSAFTLNGRTCTTS
ncbi:cellulose binding domain-containing protein [Microbispora sp. ZYX-F-249]|uniref:Cellulose binding domain-containing protein n=1 Tax=Microbispora maris TaxID=3144104 RepID=A0ABV0B3F9_9ACTN